jgi:hypothetical protein
VELEKGDCKMSSFISYIFVVVCIILAVPITVGLLSSAGWNNNLGELPNEFSDWSAPDLSNYTPSTGSPIDAAIAFVTMSVVSIGWIGTIIVKSVMVYPLLVDFFHIPGLIAVPISALIWMLGIFFIFYLWSGRDVGA